MGILIGILLMSLMGIVGLFARTAWLKYRQHQLRRSARY
jgi:hypothetical protein